MTDLSHLSLSRRSLLDGLAATGLAATGSLLSTSPAHAASACGIYTAERVATTTTHKWFEVYTRVLTATDVGKTITLWVKNDGNSTFNVKSCQLMRQTGPSTWGVVQPNWYISGGWAHGVNLAVKITSSMVGHCMLLNGYVDQANRAISTTLTAWYVLGGTTSAKTTVTIPFGAGASTPAGPAVPAAAAAAGFSKLFMNTEFNDLSAIDLTGTGDASKTWFTDRPWHPTFPTRELSITEKGLRIAPSTNNGPNLDLCTVSKTSKAGTGIKYGYFEATLSFDAYGQLTETTTVEADGTWSDCGGWPSFWLYSADSFKNEGAAKSGEIDILEYHNNPAWGWGRYTGGPATHMDGIDLFITEGDKGRQEDLHDGVLDMNQGLHTFACLWTPGRIEWFIDGVSKQVVTYGATIKPTFNGRTLDSKAVGAYAYLDQLTDGMCVVLGTGRTMPLTVKSVRVWTK